MDENPLNSRRPIEPGSADFSHDFSHDGGEKNKRSRGVLVFVLTAALAGAAFYFYQPDMVEAGYESASLLASNPGNWGRAAFSDPALGTERETPRDREAALSVTSYPSEADVFLGGKLIGKTPITDHPLQTNAYFVTLRKSGYRSVDSVIFVRPSERRRLRIRLQAGSSAEERRVPVARTERARPDRLESDREALASPQSSETASPRRAAQPDAASELSPDELVPLEEGAEEYDQYMAEGNEYLIQERYAAARRAYEMALKARPGDGKAVRRIERVEALIKEEEEARRLFSYHEGKGDVYLESKNYEAAIESYETALEHMPGDDRVQGRLAQSQKALQAAQQEAESRSIEQRRKLPNGAYISVDQRPRLVGGLKALHQKMNYPKVALQRGVEGRVTVQMIVDEEGRVRDAVVLKGIGSGCDEEALRVVRRARFEPAEVDGKPVAAQHALWVQFKVER